MSKASRFPKSIGTGLKKSIVGRSLSYPATPRALAGVAQQRRRRGPLRAAVPQAGRPAMAPGAALGSRYTRVPPGHPGGHQAGHPAPKHPPTSSRLSGRRSGRSSGRCRSSSTPRISAPTPSASGQTRPSSGSRRYAPSLPRPASPNGSQQRRPPICGNCSPGRPRSAAGC